MKRAREEEEVVPALLEVKRAMVTHLSRTPAVDSTSVRSCGIDEGSMSEALPRMLAWIMGSAVADYEGFAASGREDAAERFVERFLLGDETPTDVLDRKHKHYTKMLRVDTLGLVIKQWETSCEKWSIIADDEKRADYQLAFFLPAVDAIMGLAIRSALETTARKAGRSILPTQHIALTLDAVVHPTGRRQLLRFSSVMEDAGCLSMEDLVRAVVRMGEDDVRTLMGAYVQVLFTLEVLAALGIIDSDRHLGNMHVVDAPDNMANRTWAYDMGDGTYLCLPPTTHQNLFVMLFDFDDARIVTSPRRRWDLLLRSMIETLAYCPTTPSDAQITDEADRLERCNFIRFNVFAAFRKDKSPRVEQSLRELLASLPDWQSAAPVQATTVRWAPPLPLPPLLEGWGEPVVVGWMPPRSATSAAKKTRTAQ